MCAERPNTPFTRNTGSAWNTRSPFGGLLFVSFGLIFFLTSLVRAADLSFTFQSGVINGSYLGADSGDIEMASTMDLSAEVITSSRESYVARSSISLDPETAIIRYLYAGMGRRFYLFSRTQTQGFADGSHKISVQPKVQYFVTGELGVSQVVIRQVTPALSIQSTSIEYGGSLGMIYPVSKTVGVFASGGLGKGIGISSVAVDSTIFKAMVGITIR